MQRFTVEVVQQSGRVRMAHVTLPELERENQRIYLQPQQGEPIRVELEQGDSVVLTVE